MQLLGLFVSLYHSQRFVFVRAYPLQQHLPLKTPKQMMGALCILVGLLVPYILHLQLGHYRPSSPPYKYASAATIEACLEYACKPRLNFLYLQCGWC